MLEPQSIQAHRIHQLEFFESVGERFVSTADDGRMVLLQNYGLIVFLSNSTPAIVSRIRSALRDCCDLTFSRDGRWMIVANRIGMVERFDSMGLFDEKGE